MFKSLPSVKSPLDLIYFSCHCLLFDCLTAKFLEKCFLCDPHCLLSRSLFMPRKYLSYTSLSVGRLRVLSLALLLLHTHLLGDLDNAVSSVTIYRLLTSKFTSPAHISVVVSDLQRCAQTSLLVVPQGLQTKQT